MKEQITKEPSWLYFFAKNIDNNIPVFKDFHLLNVSEFMILNFYLFLCYCWLLVSS